MHKLVVLLALVTIAASAPSGLIAPIAYHHSPSLAVLHAAPVVHAVHAAPVVAPAVVHTPYVAHVPTSISSHSSTVFHGAKPAVVASHIPIAYASHSAWPAVVSW